MSKEETECVAPLCCQQHSQVEHSVPSKQEIKTVTDARELWDSVPGEEGDEMSLYEINALDVNTNLHPEVTDPKQRMDNTLEFIEMYVPNREGNSARAVEGTDDTPKTTTTLPPHL